MNCICASLRGPAALAARTLLQVRALVKDKQFGEALQAAQQSFQRHRTQEMQQVGTHLHSEAGSTSKTCPKVARLFAVGGGGNQGRKGCVTQGLLSNPAGQADCWACRNQASM